MKFFVSIFAVSITVFFFFSLSAAYSWIFYLSATIHKNYMFLFCNSLLVFICLNSRSNNGVSPEKDYGQEVAEKKQAAGYYESRPLYRCRTVSEVGDEKETGSLHVEHVREDQVLTAEDDDEKAGETLYVAVEEIYDDDCDGEVAGDDDEKEIGSLRAVQVREDGVQIEEDDDEKAGETLYVVNEEIYEYDRDGEVAGEDDEKETRSLHVVQVREDWVLIVEDSVEKAVETLHVVDEEIYDDDRDGEVAEDDKTLPVNVEESQEDELEVVEDNQTLSVIEEICNDDEQEQGGGIDTISLEELNKKFEEFIRTTKEQIRKADQTIQCH